MILTMLYVLNVASVVCKSLYRILENTAENNFYI